MTPAGEVLRAEISRTGPVPFSRFMRAALYHPAHGYYARPSDPFGKEGDYFTAEQVQPVFGILIAQTIRSLREELGNPEDFTVVELGAGRGEMADALDEFRYVPVELNRGAIPDSFTGVVFSNEFFDALPVDVFTFRNGAWRQMRVDWEDHRFRWVEGEPARDESLRYLERYALAEEGITIEVNLDALHWLGRIAVRLARGYVITIDYGYTTRELRRFPLGTLMSYRRHQALDDVLAQPGQRDITAHVSFTALQDEGSARGLETVRFATLAQFLLGAGEADQFAAVLQTAPGGEIARRLQLKTLLFGMGEVFRVLVQRKAAPRQ